MQPVLEPLYREREKAHRRISEMRAAGIEPGETYFAHLRSIERDIARHGKWLADIIGLMPPPPAAWVTNAEGTLHPVI